MAYPYMRSSEFKRISLVQSKARQSLEESLGSVTQSKCQGPNEMSDAIGCLPLREVVY